MPISTPCSALFDSLEEIHQITAHPVGQVLKYPNDFKYALQFLRSYTGSKGTFNAYRREVERLLQWSWNIANKSIRELTRQDIENFINFCQKPEKAWIGIKKSPRFILDHGMRVPNPQWKPFVVTLSKSLHRKGLTPEVKNFELSQGSLKEIFAILSTFYNYLIQEEFAHMNPVALIRQKSKFIRKYQEIKKIRRLTQLQWQVVIETAEKMANENPVLHERTLFIMSALYLMYLRISELAADTRWHPQMNNFYRDHDGLWWFVTVGKGNKQRDIAVSDSMLAALKRWRFHLGLSSLPSVADYSSLLPKNKGKGPITSTTYLREIVQTCFDAAISNLKEEGFVEEAESLTEATVHWLRHTGISEDVKHRPREHVRDDAGHSSSAITDKYIDIEKRERHATAKRKPINES